MSKLPKSLVIRTTSLLSELKEFLTASEMLYSVAHFEDEAMLSATVALSI